MVKKKGVEYPKDYNECCNVLGDDDKMSLEKMNELRKLVNARNAYWKLYGEANGLGGSWKPDWDDGCYLHQWRWLDRNGYTVLFKCYPRFPDSRTS